MDWKFVMGIYLPAAGAGLIWLITIARNDPDLFNEIDRGLKGRPLFFSLAAIVIGFSTYFSTPKREPDALVIAVIVVGSLWVLSTALPFLRRISLLPPKPKP